jgi:hypothetical protein
MQQTSNVGFSDCLPHKDVDDFPLRSRLGARVLEDDENWATLNVQRDELEVVLTTLLYSWGVH